MKITLSILKADVGSIGGHTRPSDHMLDAVRKAADEAIRSGLLIDVLRGAHRRRYLHDHLPYQRAK